MTHFFEVQLLLKLRRIYYHLYECVKIINFVYGLPILIHTFRTGTGLMSVLYNVGTTINEHPEVSSILSVIVWTIVLVCPIISLTVICDMAVYKSKDIGHKLQVMLLTDNVSIDVEKQLKLYCQQISKDKISFTAAWLFDVNLLFLCTFLTSISTYIVVIIQFKLQRFGYATCCKSMHVLINSGSYIACLIN
jgi:phosphoribulokinase